jgi:membrane associated rhomboid family serine protease
MNSPDTRQVDIGPPRKRYPVSTVITAVCVVLLGLSYLWASGAHGAALRQMGAESGAAVRRGEVWRLFAAAFLHADGVHFLFNMMALWSFGPMLEELLGSRRYLLLYAASALGGSLASTLLGDGAWSVGASGAIWGLMTAGIAIAVRPKGLLPAPMIAQMRSRAWLPLVANLAYSLRPGIDMRAHIGGGVVGFVLAATVLTDGLVPVEQRSKPADAEARPSRVVAALAALAAVAMGVSVVAALVTGRPWELSRAPVLRRTMIADSGLSIELPERIAGEMKIEVRHEVRVFTFGTLADSPVIFEVLVEPMSDEIPDGELDAFLEGERKTLDEKGPPRAVKTAPARRVMLGPRPGVRVDHDLEGGVHLENYLVVIGKREVLVRGYSVKDRPAAWAGLEEKVAATLGEK